MRFHNTSSLSSHTCSPCAASRTHASLRLLLSAPSLCLAVTLARFQLAATLASPRFASTFCRSIRRPPRKETSTTPSSSLSAAKVSALAELHRNHTPRGWKSIGWRPNCSSTDACSYTPILPVPARHYIPTLCRHCVATHAQSCAITSSVGSHWTSSPSSHRSLTSSLLSKRATLPTNPSTL